MSRPYKPMSPRRPVPGPGKKPSLLDAPIAAALEEARSDVASSVESVTARFENTLKGLVAAIPVAAQLDETDKPFYAQVGNVEVYTNYAQVPFGYVQAGGQQLQLVQGYRSAVEQLAKALSEHQGGDLPAGQYRYAIMLWKEPVKP